MSTMQAVARLGTSLILGTMLAGALSACSDPAVKFKSSDITGMTFSGDFSLTDHTGKPRKLSDFKGKVIVLFFGYTQCPDVCPTTLSEVDAAQGVLPKEPHCGRQLHDGSQRRQFRIRQARTVTSPCLLRAGASVFAHDFGQLLKQ